MKRCVLLLCCHLLPACPESGSVEYSPKLGGAAACIASDSVAVDVDTSGAEPSSIRFSGILLSDTEATDRQWDLGCRGTVYRALTVEDAEGVVWTIGYGLEDGDGEDITPAMDLTPGDYVQINYKTVQSFGVANGFVVEDDAEVVAAVEVGTWGNALESGDIVGLDVSLGDELGWQQGDCGRTHYHQLDFQADSLVSLYAYETTEVFLNGTAMSLHAIAATELSELVCTDLAKEVSWALFR